MEFFYFPMQAHTVVNQVQEETEAQNVDSIGVYSLVGYCTYMLTRTNFGCSHPTCCRSFTVKMQ
jgi:hypothetical protein